MTAAVVALATARCTFQPDMSSYPPCETASDCLEGFSCLAESHRCVPNCSGSTPCDSKATPEELEFIGADLPVAVEDREYQFRFAAGGGTPPYYFEATESLPSGLVLDDSGFLSGCPAVSGAFQIVLTVVDSAEPPAEITAAYSLEVQP